MLDEYFKKVSPKKRKKLLDEMTPEEEGVDEEYLDQVKKLFDERYSTDKKGNYVDHFVKVFLDFKFIENNRSAKMAKKRNEKQVLNDIHTLCLDRGDEYNREILYREMCNLTRTYISLCKDDHNYNSVVFGLGKISEERQSANIYNDLESAMEVIDEYSVEPRETLVFKEALMDMQRDLD